MKKTAVYAILLLCIVAVLTAGCIGTEEPAEPIDYATALIGDWKSVEKTSYGDRGFYIIYHFNEDNLGSMDGEINGEIFSTTPLGWGYEEENRYVVGYPQTQMLDFLYISADGKTLVNQAGEEFKKL